MKPLSHIVTVCACMTSCNLVAMHTAMLKARMVGIQLLYVNENSFCHTFISIKFTYLPSLISQMDNYCWRTAETSIIKK